MRRVSKNVFTEVCFWSCNPGFLQTSDGVVMIDSPQQPIDAMRWREMLQEKGPIHHLINTEPHADHTLGNAYFPDVEVIGQVKLQACFDQYLNMMFTPEVRLERMKKEDPDSVFLLRHPDFPASNPPKRTFKDELTLHVGNHTVKIIHMPDTLRRKPRSICRKKGSSLPAITYPRSARPSSRRLTRGNGSGHSNALKRSTLKRSFRDMGSRATRAILGGKRRLSRTGSDWLRALSRGE
jgi:Metallo-beta-lactamase superfamily